MISITLMIRVLLTAIGIGAINTSTIGMPISTHGNNLALKSRHHH